jgi:hypothetical protein
MYLHALHGKDFLTRIQVPLDFQMTLARRVWASPLNIHIIASPVASEVQFANALMSPCGVDAQRLTGTLHENRAQQTAA